ncbi:hypothetical protein GGF31_006821 [Allomyces arbusculus]|nr:hypothetical protein GGF31_006821 [Allomyces arbusculus]
MSTVSTTSTASSSSAAPPPPRRGPPAHLSVPAAGALISPPPRSPSLTVAKQAMYRAAHAADAAAPPPVDSDIPFAPPAVLADTGAISLAEFRREDRAPRRMRRTLVALQKLQEAYTPGARLAPVKPRKEKKGTLDGSGAMNKLTNLLGKKKGRQRTTAGLLHLTRMAILEDREDMAISFLDQVPSATIRKKRVDDINHLFLYAVAKRMERLALKMYEKGYPPDVNAPILVPNVAKGEIPKLAFPSFFLLVVAFGLPNLAMAMVKRAQLAQAWYGLTPLLVACAIPGPGAVPLVAQLLSHGANPTTGIPVDQYLVHKRLRPRPPAVRRAMTPSSTGTSGGVPGTPLSTTFSFPPRSSPPPMHAANGGVRGLEGYASTASSAPVAQAFFGTTTYVPDPVRLAAWVKGRAVVPLDVAAVSEHLEVANLLLRRLEKRAVREALFCMVLQQNVAVTMALWQAGADIEQRDWGNLTGLHIAARLGHFDLAYLYLETGLDPNLPGENGWTPLHEAVSQRHRDVARLLVRRGARATVVTPQGETAADLGRRAGMLASDITDFLTANASPDDVHREHAIAQRIQIAASRAASSSSSSVPPPPVPLHRTDTAGSEYYSAPKRSTSIRRRADSMPTSGAAAAAAAGPSPHHGGATTGVTPTTVTVRGHAYPAPPTPAVVPPPVPPLDGMPAHAKRKGRSRTLDKFTALRQSIFSSGTSTPPPSAIVHGGSNGSLPTTGATAVPGVRARSASSRN